MIFIKNLFKSYKLTNNLFFGLLAFIYSKKIKEKKNRYYLSDF